MTFGVTFSGKAKTLRTAYGARKEIHGIYLGWDDSAETIQLSIDVGPIAKR